MKSMRRFTLPATLAAAAMTLAACSPAVPTPTPTTSTSTTPSASPSASPSGSPSSSSTVAPSPTSSPTVAPTGSPSATPTVTPSSTPTTAPAGCVGAANTPGGADPWGGCWPGAHNTGYPKGLPGDTRTPVTLTAYTGPTTIRNCGVVIDGKTIPQDLIIEAGTANVTDLSRPCVTIRNSLVKGVVFAEQERFGPVLIEDTEVAPSGLSWWENVGRSNVTAVRVNSHGSEGVIKCDTNCVVKDSWVHGMRLGGEYHYNAVGGNGTNGFQIQHNYLTCGDWESTDPEVKPDAGCSAVIGFYGDFAQNQNITIERNFLASSFDTSDAGKHRQAAYCLNPGHYPGKPFPTIQNVVVNDNIFARGESGKCGVYGPTNALNAVGQPGTNVWSGNRFTDGEVIARPEE